MVTVKKCVRFLLFYFLVGFSLHGANGSDQEIVVEEQVSVDMESVSPEVLQKLLLGYMNQQLISMIDAYKQNQNNDDLGKSVSDLYTSFCRIVLIADPENSNLDSISFVQLCCFVLKHGSAGQELCAMPLDMRNKYIEFFILHCKSACMCDLNDYLYSSQDNLQEHFSSKNETN